MRIEELARKAAISADTIRLYEKRGLIEPAADENSYTPDDLNRLIQIRDLRTGGLTLSLIERVLGGDLDATDAPLAAAVAAAEDVDAEEFFTVAELALRTGIPVEMLEAVSNAQLLIARQHDGEARYTSADVAILGQAMSLVGTGLPFNELLDLATNHHEAVLATAERAVAMFDAHIRAPLRASSLTDIERAEKLVGAFSIMLPAVTDLVAHHFRRVLLDVAQQHLEHVGEHAEVRAAQAQNGRLIERNPGARR